MEPKRRRSRFAALVSSFLLVGAFIVFSGKFVFMAGSKANPVFQTISTAPTQPGAKPPEAPGPKPGEKTPTTPAKPGE